MHTVRLTSRLNRQPDALVWINGRLTAGSDAAPQLGSVPARTLRSTRGRWCGGGVTRAWPAGFTPAALIGDALDQDPATVGDEEVLVTSTFSGASGKRSTSESVQRRPVLSQRDLRELPRRQGLCVYGARPPARFLLRARRPTSPG